MPDIITSEKALWERAKKYIYRYCRWTLARLRAGDGGFYDNDDFMQDLYLEFRSLFEQWKQSAAQADPLAPDPDYGSLFTAWANRLARGGWCVYRRAPQRLWSGVELALEQSVAECEVNEDSESLLSRSLLDQLTTGSDSDALQLNTEVVDEVERRLWLLKPTSRQVVYLCLLEGVDAATVAEMLQMKPTHVYDRIYNARKILNGEPR